MPKQPEKPSALKSEHPALQKMKILSFFQFFGHFFPSWIRIQQLKLMRIHAGPDPDTDPDPKTWFCLKMERCWSQFNFGSSALGSAAYVGTRVQWFWLFFTFWGITTHPLHPKGPRIWKLAKKNFQLYPWPAEIFGKIRKMRFLGLVSKFNFRGPVWQIFNIFSACFIYGILNTHIKF